MTRVTVTQPSHPWNSRAPYGLALENSPGHQPPSATDLPRNGVTTSAIFDPDAARSHRLQECVDRPTAGSADQTTTCRAAHRDIPDSAGTEYQNSNGQILAAAGSCAILRIPCSPRPSRRARTRVPPNTDYRL